jgi:hypothetical protein
MSITDEEALEAATLLSNFCKTRKDCRHCILDGGTMCFVGWEPNYWAEWIEKIKTKRESNDA